MAYNISAGRQTGDIMESVIWKELPRYPGYFVSNTGLVKDPAGNLVPELLDNRGYLHVKIGDGVWELRDQYVQRLVLEAFVGPAEGRLACHKNDIPDDNRLSNLEYGTTKLNGEQHSVNRKLGKRSSRKCISHVKYRGHGRLVHYWHA